MKKLIIILMLLPTLCYSQIWKEHDKQAHFFAGAVISESTYIFVYNRTENKKTATIWAIAAPVVVGILKECVDYANPNKRLFDNRDIFATSCGAGIVIPLNIEFGLKNKRQNK